MSGDDGTPVQDLNLEVAAELAGISDAAGIPIWFFGGYGLDALQGRTTRPHGDVDFFVGEGDCRKLVAALVAVGYEVRAEEPGHVQLSRAGRHCDCVTWRRLPDGSAVTDTGDTGAFRWPDGSFPAEPNGLLAGRPVRAVSYEALYCLKAGFVCYDPSTTPRDKDREDLAVIRENVTEERRRELAGTFHPVPGTRRRFPPPQGTP
jgi:lincosamide nucleotidyltransferase A/C/D/E